MAYPGWTMAFVAFMTFALTIGPAASTMPLIYSGVVADFGWSLTDAMLVYTYKNVASAVATLLLVGPLVARFGLRNVAVGAFADPDFPAPTIAVYEERRHAWAVMPAVVVERRE